MSTADRLLLVLDLFSLEQPHWSIEEAAQQLNMTTSTAYRYFNSLTTAGLLATLGQGRYVLGPTVIRYDRQLRLTDPLISAARPEMNRVAALDPGRVVVFLCRLFSEQVICVHQEALGAPHFAVAYERGRLMPLFTGSASKIILVNLPPRQLRALYSRSEAAFAAGGWGSNWPDVRRNLREMRSAGFCQSTAELDRGMRGLSVPLTGPSGAIIGSLSVAAPVANLPADSIDRFIAALQDAALRTQQELARQTLVWPGR